MTSHSILTRGQQKGPGVNAETARMMTDIPAYLQAQG
jgi:hypothetical protein